jgi:hypothetical protein
MSIIIVEIPPSILTRLLIHKSQVALVGDEMLAISNTIAK